jgi:hypothetical protein
MALSRGGGTLGHGREGIPDDHPHMVQLLHGRDIRSDGHTRSVSPVLVAEVCLEPAMVPSLTPNSILLSYGWGTRHLVLLGEHRGTVMRRTFLSFGVLLSTLGGVMAQQSLPPEARAAIEESRKGCDEGEKFTMKRGFITRRDINGDSVSDVILDYEHSACGEYVSRFCGTGGCLFQIFASRDGNYMKVLDDDVYSVRFERVGGRPATIQSLHGVHCGRAGAEGDTSRRPTGTVRNSAQLFRSGEDDRRDHACVS